MRKCCGIVKSPGVRLTHGRTAEKHGFFARRFSYENRYPELHLGGENSQRDRKIQGVWGQVKDSTHRKEQVSFPGMPES